MNIPTNTTKKLAALIVSTDYYLLLFVSSVKKLTTISESNKKGQNTQRFSNNYMEHLIEMAPTKGKGVIEQK